MVERLNTYFTLDNCLFWAVKFTWNADSDKYWYSDYGVGFDARLQFSLSDCSWKKLSLFMELITVLLFMLIIKKKDILVHGEGSTQELDDTTIKV